MILILFIPYPKSQRVTKMKTSQSSERLADKHQGPQQVAETKCVGLSPHQLGASLIISVGEARKILGVDAKGRTDDEIAQEVLELTDLAQKLLNTSFLPNKKV